MMQGTPREQILLVDDEEAWLRTLRLNLARSGLNNTVTCNDPRSACEMLDSHSIVAAVIDLVMPQMDGETLLRNLHERAPELPVIIVTGVRDVATAVRCVKAGAFDFFVKSTEIDTLVLALRRALEIGALRRQTDRLRARLLEESLEHPEYFEDIVTRDRAMQALFRYIEATAPSTEPFFITGETGTGKEMIARALHRASRREGPLVAVNVGGLDDSVFADTLFGHRKGAYTGADTAREGLVKQASGGTLFLDEIGDLSRASQTKLLRLLQEREYYPLGSDTPLHTDARIVVATHRTIDEMQHSGQFRQDLLYRLRTFHVQLPPLRERRGDMPLLVAHFVTEAAESLGRGRPEIAQDVAPLLSEHPFPGNVRELRALVFDAVTLSKGPTLNAEAFHGLGLVLSEGTPGAASLDPGQQVIFGEQLPTLKECAALLIDEAMRRANGNQGTAAAMLGVTRQALNSRLRQAATQDGE